MSWFKSTLIRSSIHALFSTGAGSAGGRPADDGANMEDIRHRMLALTSQDDGERGALLARRIRYANELQALWFMRGELMALLAHTYGEAAARQMVDSLSNMFSDLLPPSLQSRPSPLSGNHRGADRGLDE